MISICIPLFNFDSRKLICDLSEQAEKLSVPYEILAVDDASEETFRLLHRELSLPCFRYMELEKNIGRSKIRNLLIRESKFPYLVFMDCDAAIPSQDYLSNYLPFCQKNMVCYGGRAYDTQPPEAKYVLHWKYGVNRESLMAERRREKANYGFCTNNFLADKALLGDIGFDERIKGYGHEDTLMGLELAKKGIVIQHIDNPLIHIGLEDVSDYLPKINNSLKNLREIACLLKEDGVSVKQLSGIAHMETVLQSIRIKGVVSLFYAVFYRWMLKNLKGNRPSLFIFDIYRLGFYCSL